MKSLGVVAGSCILLIVPTVMWSQHTAPTALTVNKDAKGKDETRHLGNFNTLRGTLVDHTRNHGKDNRIWSRAMFEWRDLYIYLPPGYDPRQQYPIMLFLHPFTLDERFFLSVVPLIDDAIVQGKMPPIIVAAPDGSLDGVGSLKQPGSFFLNSGAGSYEDFLFQDVWDFVCQRYPIRPERCAHVLAGASMGGHAAFNLALRNRQTFGAVIGIHPPLNMRWADVDGNPRAKFDPRRWGWRTGFDNPKEVMATYFGAFKIFTSNVIHPVFGVGEEGLHNIACNNPLELLINTRYQNGELAMFVGYAGRDEFNVDAQVESFLYYCKFKGIGVAVAFEPDGRHDTFTALKLFPAAFEWLGPQIAPYAPPGPPLFHPRYPAPGPKEPAPSMDLRWPGPGPLDPGVKPPFDPIYPATKAIPPRQPVAPRYPSTGVPSHPVISAPAGPLRWPGLGI